MTWAACLFIVFLQCTSSFLFSSGALYNSSDPVVILEEENFYSQVLGQKYGWVIEFYNSWCGHCIEFAPIWKAFAKDIVVNCMLMFHGGLIKGGSWVSVSYCVLVFSHPADRFLLYSIECNDCDTEYIGGDSEETCQQGWGHTVKVGVVDCAEDKNIDICREYEVLSYPSMKMFGARVTKGDVGTPMVARKIPGLQHLLIDFLVKQQVANNGSESWVNLQPYIGDISDIWKAANEHDENAAVIVEGKDSYIGRSSILDLGRLENTLLVCMEHNSQMGMDLNDSSLPAVIFVDREKGKSIETKVTTREQMTALIAKHFNLDRKTLHYREALKANKMEDWTKKDEAEGGGDGKPEEISSDKLNYDDDLPDSAYVNRNPIDQVFMVDIENALSYAFRHEVASHKVITGEALQALQSFLGVLASYLPVKPGVLKFLSELHDYAIGHDDVIRAEDFLNKIDSMQSSEIFLPEQKEWVGCKGSASNYRGYPCGLWTTFHTLTVNAVLKDGDHPDFDPLAPLRAIYAYVKYFFSCSHCSRHFQKMFNEDAEQSVHNPDDCILWLWRGHNKVNKRLKGHLSEDPKHPKQPYPSQTACPQCWNNGGDFNESHVLRYLKSVYSRGAISLEDTQTMATKVRNRQSKIYETLQNNSKSKDVSQQGRLKINQKKINSYETNIPNNSWGFNNTDISLCVMLYGLSTVILVSVYLMFVIRKKLRRKKFFDIYKQPNQREAEMFIETS